MLLWRSWGRGQEQQSPRRPQSPMFVSALLVYGLRRTGKRDLRIMERGTGNCCLRFFFETWAKQLVGFVQEYISCLAYMERSLPCAISNKELIGYHTVDRKGAGLTAAICAVCRGGGKRTNMVSPDIGPTLTPPTMRDMARPNSERSRPTFPDSDFHNTAPAINMPCSSVRGSGRDKRGRDPHAL